MSIEYYYVNDLNKLYNAAVGDKTDGGEYHMAMMEAHDNLEEYIQKIEHWRDTALQLSKNLGMAQNKIDNLEQDYVISNRELLVKQVEIDRLTAELTHLTAELVEKGEYENKLVNTVDFMQTEIDRLTADLARRDASLHYANTVCMEQKHVIDRLKEDAERLTCVGAADATICPCGYPDFRDTHSPDCPITLHRALMKEI